MNCRSFQDQMHEYVEGSLAADTRAAAEQHLAVCGVCRTAAEKEKQFARVLSKRLRQESEALTLRPDIRRNILAAARREPMSPPVVKSVVGWWQQWIRLAVPATALLIVAGIIIAIHFSGTLSRQTIQISPTNGLATEIQPPAQSRPAQVSIQISCQMPTYQFHPEGNEVVDALSAETVVTSGAFQPDAKISLPQMQPLKTPL